eukprot:12491430-Alexandrium_andersonii.AAC.1
MASYAAERGTCRPACRSTLSLAARTSMAGLCSTVRSSSHRSTFCHAAAAAVRKAAGPHQRPSRWMTAPTAADTAMGQRGPPRTPSKRTVATGSHQGAQPQPLMA